MNDGDRDLSIMEDNVKDMNDVFNFLMYGLTLTNIVSQPPGTFDAYMVSIYRYVSDRCPKCGYKWTQPHAFLSGQEC